jgi:hypothetical protein
LERFSDARTTVSWPYTSPMRLRGLEGIHPNELC